MPSGLIADTGRADQGEPLLRGETRPGPQAGAESRAGGSGQNAGQSGGQRASQPATQTAVQGTGSSSGQSGEVPRAGQGEPSLHGETRAAQQPGSAGVEPRATPNTATPAAPGPAIGNTAHVQSAMPSATSPPPMPQLPDSRQILGQLRAHVSDNGTIRVALRPEGLGRVEISLAPRPDGQLAVALRADQPAVLSSLRADRDGLVALLRDAGHQIDARAVSFADLDRPGGGDGLRQALGQGLRDGTGQQAAQHSAGGQGQTPDSRPEPAASADAAADPHEATGRATGSPGAVDITV